ncbi:MAG: hypothetical protein ACK2T7_12725 [Anaerolineales bacterium]
MTKKKLLVLLLGGIFALLLAGCNCTNTAVSAFDVILDHPVGYEIVTSLNPTFEWHGSDSCQPDHFKIQIHENTYNFPNGIVQDISGDLSNYTLSGDSLLPGREYAWNMRAWNDFSQDDSAYNYGPFSADSYFYTGPVCSGETLVAPDLQYPREHSNEQLDNWITHNHLQEFKWAYSGGCLPVSYDYQFASDIGFTDIILSGTTTEPYAMHTFQQFPNCSSVFWRVAANDGTTTGPWSDIWQFHWVTDETCWQTHYISDDAARIQVRLYEDLCDMTGYSTPLNARIVEGCKRWKNSTLITAEGDFSDTVFSISDIRVDLGPGPCPSTGLDHKGTFDTFNVLTPGIYCVSISRNQSGQTAAGDVNLMKGIWVEPRTDEVLAYKTIELSSGPQDLDVDFFWDSFEPVTLFYPVPENINCRRGPEIICDPLKIPMAGEILPIMARDMETEWKLTSYEGELCYVYLPAVQINEALVKVEGNGWLTEDLPFYEPPPPCPPPAPEPSQNCSKYTTESSCQNAGCKWVTVFGTTGTNDYCTTK